MVEGAISIFLRGQRDGSLHQPGVATYCVQNADRDLRLGGIADKHPGKCGYGLPTMPGGQGPGRQGLQTSDDKRGAELSVEATGTGPMTRVQEGPSKGVTSYPLPNPVRRGDKGGRGRRMKRETETGETIPYRLR